MESLPSELRVHVLSFLSGTQIRRMKQLNKIFKSTIIKNKKYLPRPRISIELDCKRDRFVFQGHLMTLKKTVIVVETQTGKFHLSVDKMLRAESQDPYSYRFFAPFFNLAESNMNTDKLLSVSLPDDNPFQQFFDHIFSHFDIDVFRIKKPANQLVTDAMSCVSSNSQCHIGALRVSHFNFQFKGYKVVDSPFLAPMKWTKNGNTQLIIDENDWMSKEGLVDLHMLCLIGTTHKKIWNQVHLELIFVAIDRLLSSWLQRDRSAFPFSLFITKSKSSLCLSSFEKSSSTFINSLKQLKLKSNLNLEDIHKWTDNISTIPNEMVFVHDETNRRLRFSVEQRIEQGVVIRLEEE